jgi:hypothetical protein
MPVLSPPRKLLQMQAWMANWRPMDALLPLSMSLHTYKSTRELGVGLLVAWMLWRLSQSLIRGDDNGPGTSTPRPYLGMFLALLLLNARPIVMRDDLYGPSQFLLIALGFVIGLQLSSRSWKITLGWLAVCILPLLGQFVMEAMATGSPYSIASIKTIYEASMRGHGGINRFATLILMLTMSAWYFLLSVRSRMGKVLAMISVICGYILCLGSGSRIAIYGAPLAALLAWSFLRLYGRDSKTLRFIIFGVGATFASVLLWWFLLSPEASRNRLSDLFRFEAASCWLSIMFSGQNRFLWGVGYGSETSNKICDHIPDFRGQVGTIGHAHNTFAQIAGQHGLLGLIALAIVAMIILQGIRLQLAAAKSRLPLALGPSGITWAEIAIGLNLAITFNVLATTVYIYNQINQLLIGLLCASAIRSVSLSRKVATLPSYSDQESP